MTAVPSVLVTGTSTGIGEACVRRLAAAGWTVYAGVRRDEDGDRLKAEIPGDVRPVRLDVTDAAQMRAVLDTIAADVGDAGLDGLVNNAGVGVGGPVELVPEQDWRFVFDVNFFGVLALTTAALPLVERAGGRIVHIGSLGGRLSSPGLGPYSATKHALEALAESMRHEQKMSGSRVRTALVEPGAIETAIWDKGDTTVDEMEARLDDDARRRYGWLIDQSRGFVHEGRRRGIAPDRVAKKVEHALTARRPRARYLVGPDAKIAGFVSRVLPDRGRDGFVRANARHEIKVGRKLRTKA